MPNWQPNWQDVRWNFAAADAAAAALDRAAGTLDRTEASRDQVAQRAQADWFGKYSLEFMTQLSGMDTTAQSLAARLRAAAKTVRSFSGRATMEQAQRERDRARWRREKADEDAAKARKQSAGSHP